MILAVLLVVPAACSQPTPPPPKFDAIGFADQPPIRLAVNTIELVQQYQPPLQKPNVDHQFPIPPAQIAARWAQDRLAAAGGTLTARFIIRNAAVVESDLAKTEGIRGVFTKDQAEQYDATLEVALEIVNAQGQRVANVASTATRSQTVAEGIDWNQRQTIWYAMSQELAATTDRQLSQNIDTGLSAYLAR